jgi:hypothetical protein
VLTESRTIASSEVTVDSIDSSREYTIVDGLV